MYYVKLFIQKYTMLHKKKLCDFIGYCLKGILNGVDITPNITLKKGIF